MSKFVKVGSHSLLKVSELHIHTRYKQKGLFMHLYKPMAGLPRKRRSSSWHLWTTVTTIDLGKGKHGIWASRSISLCIWRRCLTIKDATAACGVVRPCLATLHLVADERRHRPWKLPLFCHKTQGTQPSATDACVLYKASMQTIRVQSLFHLSRRHRLDVMIFEFSVNIDLIATHTKYWVLDI